jgi:2-(1,2-epoxy-1,2-dihydrophenyl)acetyl-CoA isomerase
MTNLDTTTRSETPSADDLVLYCVENGVAEIRLNRPTASNALNLAMTRALHEAVLRADRDDVGAVLLVGEGRLFCGGGDLDAMNAAPDRRAFVAELAAAAHAALLAIDALSKPVVTGVQGAAAGIGFSLVLGSDLVIAGESAKFVTAYTTVGLTPDGGMSWRLPRTVGQRVASELILTSGPVGAERAQALGIVSTICPDADVEATARAAAITLAQRPPHALSVARMLVRSSWTHSLHDHLNVEAAMIAEAAGADEAGALIANFVSRRR